MIRTKPSTAKFQFNILTNDPSFTAWGWAVLDVRGHVLDRGCKKTEPEHKKRRIRASDDRVRRTQELVIELMGIIKKYDIKFILSELPHGSQNANAAIMMGIVMGIVTAIGETLHLPVEFYSEQDAKKALLGKKAATKTETVDAIKEHYDVKYSGVKYIDEAVADALAIHYVAKQQSPVLKMVHDDKL